MKLPSLQALICIVMNLVSFIQWMASVHDICKQLCIAQECEECCAEAWFVVNNCPEWDCSKLWPFSYLTVLYLYVCMIVCICGIVCEYVVEG